MAPVTQRKAPTPWTREITALTAQQWVPRQRSSNANCGRRLDIPSLSVFSVFERERFSVVRSSACQPIFVCRPGVRTGSTSGARRDMPHTEPAIAELEMSGSVASSLETSPSSRPRRTISVPVISGFEIQSDDNARGDSSKDFYGMRPDLTATSRTSRGTIYKIQAGDRVWFDYEIVAQRDDYTAFLTNLQSRQRTQPTKFRNTDVIPNARRAASAFRHILKARWRGGTSGSKLSWRSSWLATASGQPVIVGRA